MRISDWSSDVCSSDLLSAALKGSPRKEHPDLKRWIKEDADRLAGLAKQDFKTESGRVHTAQWVIEATKAMPKNAIHARAGGRTVLRSDERRVGKERVITCRSWWAPYH